MHLWYSTTCAVHVRTAVLTYTIRGVTDRCCFKGFTDISGIQNVVYSCSDAVKRGNDWTAVGNSYLPVRSAPLASFRRIPHCLRYNSDVVQIYQCQGLHLSAGPEITENDYSHH